MMGLTETVCLYVCVCDSENILLVGFSSLCACVGLFFVTLTVKSLRLKLWGPLKSV